MMAFFQGACACEQLIHGLALGVVVADLVQEELLHGVQLLGPVEEDGGDAHVPAQGQAEGRAQQRREPEEPSERHLRGTEHTHRGSQVGGGTCTHKWPQRPIVDGNRAVFLGLNPC